MSTCRPSTFSGAVMESSGAVSLKLTVKFGGRSIPVSVYSDSTTTVKDVKLLLQPLTNVLPRGQKLIFKGKVLEDNMSLKSLNITNGSKLMLMASQGLHQGDGPITAKSSQSSPVPTSTSQANANANVTKTQPERWKITGVIALSDSQFKVIPDEVLACGTSVRLLDLSNNFIHELPIKIGSLSSIQKLLLDANNFVDECFSWEGLTLLKSLTVLSLNQNGLMSVPPSVGSLSSLRELHVANNKLTSLALEIGFLRQLEILNVKNNRLSDVPSHMGNCISLVEIDLSSNLLVDLPDTMGELQNLKALHLRNNGLKSLPSTLFKLCSKLSTLDLHGTEITMDLLRQFEGWEGFDSRRRSKLQKKLDFSVGCPEGFDEGADKKD